jgi:mycothiol synthase
MSSRSDSSSDRKVTLMHRLPDGYALRHPGADELPAVQVLMDLTEAVDAPEPRKHDIDVVAECADPRVAPETNTWVVVAPDGAIVGFAWVMWMGTGEGVSEQYVHPDHRGRGIGEVLLDSVEVRAEELAGQAGGGASPTLSVWCESIKDRLRESLRGRGFTKVRDYYTMVLDPATTVEDPAWPPGLEVRPFRAGEDDRRVYKAHEEAFSEHFLVEPQTFEEWCAHSRDLGDLDPDLWLVAWDGDVVAAECLTLSRGPEADVISLSVRRPWRGRGLGLALLLECFGRARLRGHRTIRLVVDVENVTGALRLYERAGMRVERRFDVFRRSL